MYYSISKKTNKSVFSFDFCEIEGYTVTPKNRIQDAILVSEMTIVKPEFIKKILKKKVRLMLENLDSQSDDDDTRKALDIIERYKLTVNKKYAKFLDDKYMSLLNQKFDILEREFKNNLKMEKEKKARKEAELEMLRLYEMQDEIEEKENRRTR